MITACTMCTRSRYGLPDETDLSQEEVLCLCAISGWRKRPHSPTASRLCVSQTDSIVNAAVCPKADSRNGPGDSSIMGLLARMPRQSSEYGER